ARDADLGAAAALLDDDERGRARRLLLPQSARRFILSRAALRAVLAAQLGVAPRDVALSGGAAGKPELAAHGERAGAGRAAPSLRFNLSHSGDLALVALARDREVGVDVEQRRPLPDLERLARRVLAPEEVADFLGLPEADKEAALLRCWTRKEALVKAAG